MRSQTNAMPLSVLLVPEGAGDYELIPLDFGPRGLAGWKSHSNVFTEMLQVCNRMFTEML